MSSDKGIFESARTAGAFKYQGTWNANTNTPTLASGVGTQGDVYYVSVAGSTNLDGITDWNIGDYATFNGTVWQKWDNTDFVTSVAGKTGVVTLVPADIGLENDGLQFIIDGNGFAITATIKGDIIVPFDCTIASYTILADQSGSIQVDVWKDTYANFPPTNADSITASAPITITTATKNTDSTLTGWTKSLTKGDVLRFFVDSCTSIERVSIILQVTKS